MTSPPYLRIAASIRDRIHSGDLRPGDRVPSTRAIVREWGVAMVTAAKALDVLRHEGLVESRPGSGTVVRAGDHARPGRPERGEQRALTRRRIVIAAIRIADADGFEALSMRRLAATLDVGAMTLYRHFASKDELANAMMREVLGARPLPADPPVAGPEGWRTALELVCRVQWERYRTHHWLAELVSLTRPRLVPEAMEHTEWTLRVLAGLGLPPAEAAREAMALPALVRGLALSGAAEVAAERATGLTNVQWWTAVAAEAQDLLGTGRFPHLAAVPEGIVDDLDGLFEHGLARHLDGLAARLRGQVG